MKLIIVFCNFSKVPASDISLQDISVSGLCPSSGVPRRTQVSKTKCVSVLRWEGEEVATVLISTDSSLFGTARSTCRHIEVKHSYFATIKRSTSFHVDQQVSDFVLEAESFWLRRNTTRL